VVQAQEGQEGQDLLPYKPELSPVGCVVYPYSGAALLRQPDWLVCIKGCGRYVWNGDRGGDPETLKNNPLAGGEITNILGHYLSHGSVTVMAGKPAQDQNSPVREGNGIRREASGGSKGYDWLHVPGATSTEVLE
jgi:hypothetical protein